MLVDTTADFAVAPPPLVLTDAATTTVFTVALPSQVLAEAAASAVFAPAPLPLVLAEGAVAAVFAPVLPDRAKVLKHAGMSSTANTLNFKYT